MPYPPHEWGPAPSAPGYTRCLWCHVWFVHAGGTRCEIAAAERAVIGADTSPMRQLPEPRRLGRAYWVAVAVVLLWLLAGVLAAVTADTPAGKHPHNTNPPTPRCGQAAGNGREPGRSESAGGCTLVSVGRARP